MLQDCPLCQLVKKSSQMGDHCAVVQYGGKKAVVLLKHLAVPSAEALQEATEFVAPRSATKQAPSALSSDIREVAGHWGITTTPVSWLQQPGARYSDGNKPQA